MPLSCPISGSEKGIVWHHRILSVTQILEVFIIGMSSMLQINSDMCEAVHRFYHIVHRFLPQVSSTVFTSALDLIWQSEKSCSQTIHIFTDRSHKCTWKNVLQSMPCTCTVNQEMKANLKLPISSCTTICPDSMTYCSPVLYPLHLQKREVEITIFIKIEHSEKAPTRVGWLKHEFFRHSLLWNTERGHLSLK